jgi:hypothetical protein
MQDSMVSAFSRTTSRSGSGSWSLWPRSGRVDEQALRQLAVDPAPIRDDLRANAEASGCEFA